MLLPLDQALEATSTGMTELQRTTTVGLLRPGLPPEQTRALLAERGLVPSAEPEGRGEVIHFRIDESEQPVEFASISHMVNTTAAAYSEQVYFIDEDGYLEMDDLAFSRVASRLNPDVAWWQD
ncbi:hypothetical protein [Pedococcus aerophilus]